MYLAAWSMYLFTKLVKHDNQDFKNVGVKNLMARHFYSGAMDVLELYERLGWLSPIFSKCTVVSQLLLHNAQKDPSVKTLVFSSERSMFATNIPALLKLLMLWLSKKKNLLSNITVRVNESYLCDAKGNLPAEAELPEFDINWYRMKVYHRDFRVERSIPDAVVGLISDGLATRQRDGITFMNMLKDLDLQPDSPETKDKILKMVKEMDSARRQTFARELVDPTAKDKLNMRERAEKAGKSNSHSAASKDAPVPTASLSGFQTKGNFSFPAGDLNNIFGKEKNHSSSQIKDTITTQMSVHAEKLVRLAVANAAASRIDDEDNVKLTATYLQDNTKGESNAIMNGLSADICNLVTAISNWSLKSAESYIEQMDPVTAFSAVSAVRDGDIPVDHIREKLRFITSALLADPESTKQLLLATQRESTEKRNSTRKMKEAELMSQIQRQNYDYYQEILDSAARKVCIALQEGGPSQTQVVDSHSATDVDSNQGAQAEKGNPKEDDPELHSRNDNTDTAMDVEPNEQDQQVVKDSGNEDDHSNMETDAGVDDNSKVIAEEVASPDGDVTPGRKLDFVDKGKSEEPLDSEEEEGDEDSNEDEDEDEDEGPSAFLMEQQAMMEKKKGKGVQRTTEVPKKRGPKKKGKRKAEESVVDETPPRKRKANPKNPPAPRSSARSKK